MFNNSLKSLVFASIALSASASFASITAISGSTNLISNPNNMKYKADAYGSDITQYWDEKQDVSLVSDLVISIKAPGSFPTTSTTHFENNDNKIAAGTRVNSDYIYFDPKEESTIVRFRTRTPILGLITNERTSATNDHFMLSDHLTLAAVPVANRSASHFGARGMEISSTELVKWYAPNDVEFRFRASSPGDQVRVISAAVPEPGSILALLCGASLFLARRKN